MRIIGGKFKGRSLPISKKLNLRPTTNFAKEALFNVLGNMIDLQNSTAIELFCGSGNVSFELISRGITNLTTVDKHPASIAHMKKVASHFNVENIRFIKGDAIKYLKNYNGEPVDLIFADPPYAFGKYEELYEGIISGSALKNDGIFILEHDKKINFSDKDGFLEERKYGNVRFSIFQRRES